MEISEQQFVAPSKGYTKTVVTTLCDLDMKGKASSKCHLCKRDICYQHTRYDPDELGDYPDKYCTVCYVLKFETYRNSYNATMQDYDNTLTELDNKVRSESLSKPASQSDGEGESESTNK